METDTHYLLFLFTEFEEVGLKVFTPTSVTVQFSLLNPKPKHFPSAIPPDLLPEFFHQFSEMSGNSTMLEYEVFFDQPIETNTHLHRKVLLEDQIVHPAVVGDTL